MPQNKADNPDWYNDAKDHIWYPYTQMQMMPDPIKVKSTEGVNIVLEDGRKLIDGVSSWWASCHGYNHPYIIEKMHEQLDLMPHIMFAGTAHEQAYNLSRRLSKLTNHEKYFLTDSGSTAVETAMKIAVQYWRNKGKDGKAKFVSFKNSYHGDTMGCMSLCDPNSGMHKNFNRFMPRQFSIEIPNDEYSFAEFDFTLSEIKKSVAAVIIEPLVQGAGGMKFYSSDVLAEIYRICKKHDLLFIADEVMTGFGRTGNMFACQEAAIEPDLICLGKALTGGVTTLAAVGVKQFVYEEFLSDRLENALMSGPTFMANPLACSAANASLDLFEGGDVLLKVESLEKQLYEQLSECKGFNKVVDVRVKGAISVVQIDCNWSDIVQMRKDFVDMGVWLRPFGNIIYIMPSFTIKPQQISILTESVKEVIKKNLK